MKVSSYKFQIVDCLRERKTPTPPNMASLKIISTLLEECLFVPFSKFHVCQPKAASPALLGAVLVDVRDVVFPSVPCLAIAGGRCQRAFLVALSGFPGEGLRFRDSGATDKYV